MASRIYSKILTTKQGGQRNYKKERRRIIGFDGLAALSLCMRKDLERKYFSYLFVQFPSLLHLHCAHLKRKSKQIDESVGVVVIVQIAGGKACQ